jgi:hypothetical protein
MSDFITQNYLLQGRLFTDATFREVAIQGYLEKHQEDESAREFNCSAGFVAGFKKQNRFSSRRAHLKRRAQVTEEGKASWIAMLIQLIQDVPDSQQIINVDESCWRVYPEALQTWAPTGSQNVPLAVTGNEKDSFTVVAAITAARTKLPLYLIVKGKTEAVEQSHFGDVAHHRTADSNSGWQTTETFQEWLTWLRDIYDDGEPIWLVLDCYAVHRQLDMRQHAEELGIHLVFVPSGLTDQFQPLDRFVFGAMKGMCRYLYRVHCQSVPPQPMGRQLATGFLIRAWEQVSPQVLDEAWSLYNHE